MIIRKVIAASVALLSATIFGGTAFGNDQGEMVSGTDASAKVVAHLPLAVTRPPMVIRPRYSPPPRAAQPKTPFKAGAHSLPLKQAQRRVKSEHRFGSALGAPKASARAKLLPVPARANVMPQLSKTAAQTPVGASAMRITNGPGTKKVQPTVPILPRAEAESDLTTNVPALSITQPGPAAQPNATAFSAVRVPAQPAPVLAPVGSMGYFEPVRHPAPPLLNPEIVVPTPDR